MTADQPTPDQQRALLFDALGNDLERWQVILDVAEGFVSRTKEMGWSDEQARIICAPQVAKMLALPS